MGIYLTALLDHAVPRGSINGLDQVLNERACRPSSHQQLALPDFRDSPKCNWYWDLSRGIEPRLASVEIAMHGSASLDCTTGLSIHTSLLALEIYVPLKWGMFLANVDGLQLPVIYCLRELASTVGASQMILLPDSGTQSSIALDIVFDARTIGDALSWLLEKCGPPAISLSHLSAMDANDEDGYYIERFAPER